MTIPIIDISPFLLQDNQIHDSDRKAVEQLKNSVGKAIDCACKEWGFFYISGTQTLDIIHIYSIGHTVSETQANGMIHIAREFFKLPVEGREGCCINR